jgi:hypothetical protein
VLSNPQDHETSAAFAQARLRPTEDAAKSRLQWAQQHGCGAFRLQPRYNLASFRVLRLPNYWLVSGLQRPVHGQVARLFATSSVLKYATRRSQDLSHQKSSTFNKESEKALPQPKIPKYITTMHSQPYRQNTETMIQEDVFVLLY